MYSIEGCRVTALAARGENYLRNTVAQFTARLVTCASWVCKNLAKEKIKVQDERGAGAAIGSSSACSKPTH